MGKLLSAMLFVALLGTPTLASAGDRDGWRDGDRREWRHDRDDRHWRDGRDGRRDRDWRDRRWSHRDWRDDRRHRRHYYRYARRDVVCRTYWDYYGYPERVCYRR